MEREEAINLIKQVLPCLNIDEKIREGFVTLIPELKESEDERIRKELIEYLTHRAEVTGFIDEDKDCKRWIAYLEKQKEQKPRWEINNPHTTKWTKEMIDEKFEELVEEYHKQKPVVTHGETYHVDTLGTQQVIAGKMPQKPAEWSEENEDMLNSCISSIEEAKENRYAYKETDGDTSYDHEIDWLKSLRPQPHWKPSKVQMKALNEVANDGVLLDLFNDLLKLL